MAAFLLAVRILISSDSVTFKEQNEKCGAENVNFRKSSCVASENCEGNSS